MLVCSSLLFGGMAVCAKLATHNLSGAQVAAIRFVFQLSPVVLIPQFRRSAWNFKRIDLLFYRGFFGGLAVLLYFMGIEHIPVGLATLLNYTAPLFSGICAAIFIGERIRTATLLPLLVAFSGVVLVVRSHSSPGDLFGFGGWEAVVLCSAVLSGVAVTAIRVARRTEGSWAIFASFSIFGLLATAPFALAQWRVPSARDWSLLVLVGVFAVGAQLLMTSALRWVDTLTVGVFSQLAVISSMLFGAIWLGETITLLGAIGSLLTMAGVVSVMVISARSAPPGLELAGDQ